MAVAVDDVVVDQRGRDIYYLSGWSYVYSMLIFATARAPRSIQTAAAAVGVNIHACYTQYNVCPSDNLHPVRLQCVLKYDVQELLLFISFKNVF